MAILLDKIIEKIETKGNLGPRIVVEYIGENKANRTSQVQVRCYFTKLAVQSNQHNPNSGGDNDTPTYLTISSSGLNSTITKNQMKSQNLTGTTTQASNWMQHQLVHAESLTIKHDDAGNASITVRFGADFASAYDTWYGYQNNLFVEATVHLPGMGRTGSTGGGSTSPSSPNFSYDPEITYQNSRLTVGQDLVIQFGNYNSQYNHQFYFIHQGSKIHLGMDNGQNPLRIRIREDVFYGKNAFNELLGSIQLDIEQNGNVLASSNTEGFSIKRATTSGGGGGTGNYIPPTNPFTNLKPVLASSISNQHFLSGNNLLKGESQLTLGVASGSELQGAKQYEFLFRLQDSTEPQSFVKTEKSITFSPFQFPTTENYRNFYCSVRGIDSSGAKSKASDEVMYTVYNYERPTMGNLSVRRNADNPQRIEVIRNYKVYNTSHTGISNVVSYVIEIRQKGTSYNLSETGGRSSSYSLADSLATLNNNYNPDTPYEIRAVLQDRIARIESSWIPVAGEVIPFDIYTTGIAAGKLKDENNSYNIEASVGGIHSEGDIVTLQKIKGESAVLNSITNSDNNSKLELKSDGVYWNGTKLGAGSSSSSSDFVTRAEFGAMTNQIVFKNEYERFKNEYLTFTNNVRTERINYAVSWSSGVRSGSTADDQNPPGPSATRRYLAYKQKVGLGFLHLDFKLTSNVNTIATLPSSAPTPDIYLEVTNPDNSVVLINAGSRQIMGYGLTVGRRYIVNMSGFFS